MHTIRVGCLLQFKAQSQGTEDTRGGAHAAGDDEYVLGGAAVRVGRWGAARPVRQPRGPARARARAAEGPGGAAGTDGATTSDQRLSGGRTERLGSCAGAG